RPVEGALCDVTGRHARGRAWSGPPTAGPEARRNSAAESRLFDEGVDLVELLLLEQVGLDRELVADREQVGVDESPAALQRAFRRADRDLGQVVEVVDPPAGQVLHEVVGAHVREALERRGADALVDRGLALLVGHGFLLPGGSRPCRWLRSG